MAEGLKGTIEARYEVRRFVWMFIADEYHMPLKIKNGDKLVVFSREKEPKRVWQGVIDLVPLNAKVIPTGTSPNRPAQGVPVDGYQKKMDAGEWAEMFFRALPATLTPH